jgi:hypothetical protein
MHTPSHLMIGWEKNNKFIKIGKIGFLLYFISFYFHSNERRKENKITMLWYVNRK